MLTKVFDKITRLSIRFRWITITLAFIFMAVGIYAATQLNLEMTPRVEFPQTIVIVQWPGAEDADDFLNQVTVPLENNLQALENVVNIESRTQPGMAFIIVRNEFGQDQEAMIELIETAVADTTLPDAAETQILNFSLSDLPITVASISSSDLTLAELKELVETDLQPNLELLGGISKVTVGGGQELPDETAVFVEAEAPAEEVTAPELVEPTPEADLVSEEEPAIVEEAVVEEETAVISSTVALPDTWIAAASQMGQTLSSVGDITPEFMDAIAQTKPEMLADLTPDMLVAFTSDVMAVMPADYLANLDIETRKAITARLAPPTNEGSNLPQFAAVPLPDSWVAGAAQMGQTINSTADITPEFMGAITQTKPEMLNELTPAMWRALSPATTAVALDSTALDEGLLLQLNAIQLAANGETPTAVDLPASWVEMSTAAGFPMATTADIPPQAAGMLTSFPPEMMAELTPDIILAMDPALLAAMPAAILDSLDEGMQQTIANVIIAAEQAALTAETDATAVAEEEIVEEVDPALLPDILIQGAKSAGIEIAYAQDLDPDFVRLFAEIGEQGVQALGMLTDDNLRLMPAESIALLPAAFLDTLDADLRAELDEIAADYGGAGELALIEAAAAAEASSEAPALTGIWAEPGANGEAPMFNTAYDLLTNNLKGSAAALLNFIPDSPNGNPQFMYDLTPDVIAYLAENEEGFAENLSLIILEIMAPDSLTYLLDEYPEAFDAETTAHLRGVAAGDVEVFVPESTVTRTDGSASVIVAAYKDGDANTVESAHLVFDELDAFVAANAGIRSHLVFEQATFIEDSIAGVSRDGALGGVFAIVVILIFLSGRIGGKYKLSWRATLVTAVSIPLSVFSAFFFMYSLPPTVGVWMDSTVAASSSGFLAYIARLVPTNITLNIMTLSGLTVAIGRVVDDSIVVLENAYRHIQRGEAVEEAIVRGTREVAIAIFSATMTTVVVFLPLGLIGGLIGSFFLPFGLTVTYALLSSFVVAITVVPAMMSLLINKDSVPVEKETAIQRWYTPMLEWSLNHRFIVVLVSTLIFFGSLALINQLPKSFIPGLGEPTINVAIKMPSGTKMAETNRYAEELEAALADVDGIETVQTEIGSGGGMQALLGGNSVKQNVGNMTISVENQDDIDALTKQVREEAITVFGEELVVVSAGGQNGFGGFALTVTSDSLDELVAIAADAKEALANLDVDGDGQPDIANVDSSVDALLNGSDSDEIMQIDGRPAISFGGELETSDTLGVTNAAKQAVMEMDSLPDHIIVTEGFDSQQQVEGFQSMIRAIGIAIILVYIIMALSFGSFILPFTILFSLPFALVGAIIALYITNSNLGISAMIGFMMLVGVIVTNGIVLMELVKQLRAQGTLTYDALVEAGRTRLRPIWMTALAAILALTPLASSKEAGAIIAAELGKAVMGGLIVGTALTLIVVPVIYSALDQLGRKLSKKTV